MNVALTVGDRTVVTLDQGPIVGALHQLVLRQVVVVPRVPDEHGQEPVVLALLLRVLRHHLVHKDEVLVVLIKTLPLHVHRVLRVELAITRRIARSNNTDDC